MLFEKTSGSENFMDKGGGGREEVSKFSVEYFLSECRKFRKGTL